MQDGRCRRGILAMAAAVILVPVSAVQADDSDGAAGIRNRALGFETAPGGPAKRIILKPEMLGKFGIETALVDEGKPTAVPVGAVFYDAKGSAWVYLSRKPGLFTGQRVRIEDVADGRAFLSESLPAGTSVVTAGTAALNGAGVFGR